MGLISLSDGQKNALKNILNSAKRISSMFIYLINNIQNELDTRLDAYINKLNNIDLNVTETGDIVFTNSEGSVKGLGLSKEDQYSLFYSNLGSVNPNPTFFLKDFDYRDYCGMSENYNVVFNESKETFGSLEIKGYGDIGYNDVFLPVDVDKKYRMNILMKAKHDSVENDGSYGFTTYIGIANYDYDKNFIKSAHMTRISNTEGVLIGDYTADATTITLRPNSANGVDAWINSNWDERCILVHKLRDDGTYGYISEDGHYYDEDTYSRYLLETPFDDDSITDNGDGTLTINLNSPLGFDCNDGDHIRLSFSYDNLFYFISNYIQDIDNTYYDKVSRWKRNTSNNNDTSRRRRLFKTGTCYVKVIFMFNYGMNTWDSNDNVVPKNSLLPGLTTNVARLGFEWKHE